MVSENWQNSQATVCWGRVLPHAQLGYNAFPASKAPLAIQLLIRKVERFFIQFLVGHLWILWRCKVALFTQYSFLQWLEVCPVWLYSLGIYFFWAIHSCIYRHKNPFDHSIRPRKVPLPSHGWVTIKEWSPPTNLHLWQLGFMVCPGSRKKHLCLKSLTNEGIFFLTCQGIMKCGTHQSVK